MALETDRSAVAALGLFGEQEGFAGDGEIVVLKAISGGQLVIPNGTMLLVAEFVREGPDLLLIGPDGDRVLIRDYFTLAEPPALMTAGGAMLPPDLVALLAGPAAPGQYAQTEGGIEPQPIGRVDEMVGAVTASRVDGTTVTLSKDSPVYQGDVLDTGAGAAVAIVFIDETEFSLGEDGRMVLDELIFDPTSLEGSSSFSVIQGVFVFVSGEIAANNPDEMMVRTPVATIGIRGTKVAGKAAAEGELNTVTMMPEEGGQVAGAITVSTQTGTVTLTTAYQTTAVTSVFDSPSAPITLSPSQAGALFGAVDSLLPATAAQTRAEREDDDDDAGEESEGEEGEGEEEEELTAAEAEAAEAEARRRELYRAGSTVDDSGE